MLLGADGLLEAPPIGLLVEHLTQSTVSGRTGLRWSIMCGCNRWHSSRSNDIETVGCQGTR
jgi:hypothetical protein